jgi:endoglucanase
VRTALLSLPQKYMHTPIEVVSLADIVTVGQLMAAYLREPAV